MYCKKCLGEIQDGDKFCTSCGAPIETIVRDQVGEYKAVDQAVNSPLIQIDPKTGQSIMPDNLKSSTIKTPRVSDNNKVLTPTINKPVKQREVREEKPVDKTVELIVGIIAVALAYLTSISGAFIVIGLMVGNIFEMDVTTSNVASNILGAVLMVFLGLKGFVFATLGLIGLMNIKKNSTVAGLFFMSAGVGSLFSLELIRAGLFIAAAIICFVRNEKPEKPIFKYIIVSFLPIIIIGILVIVSFVLLIFTDTQSTINGVNSVYIMFSEMI